MSTAVRSKDVAKFAQIILLFFCSTNYFTNTQTCKRCCSTLPTTNWSTGLQALREASRSNTHLDWFLYRLSHFKKFHEFQKSKKKNAMNTINCDRILNFLFTCHCVDLKIFWNSNLGHKSTSWVCWKEYLKREVGGERVFDRVASWIFYPLNFFANSSLQIL